MKDDTIQFLMIEDDPAHTMLLKRAFKQCGVVEDLSHQSDGEVALRYLKAEGEHAQRKRPDVILLDLNLPKVSGLEILKAVKADDTLKTIPVIVLTTSSADDDRTAAHELGVNSFLTKPISYDRFREMIADVRHYWADLNRNANDAAIRDAA